MIAYGSFTVYNTIPRRVNDPGSAMILGAQASCLPDFLVLREKRSSRLGEAGRQGCLRSQAGFLPVLEIGC